MTETGGQACLAHVYVPSECLKAHSRDERARQGLRSKSSLRRSLILFGYNNKGRCNHLFSSRCFFVFCFFRGVMPFLGSGSDPAFPFRSQLQEAAPGFLTCDELSFRRPNISSLNTVWAQPIGAPSRGAHPLIPRRLVPGLTNEETGKVWAGLMSPLFCAER